MFTKEKSSYDAPTEDGACVSEKCGRNMAGVGRIFIALLFVVGGIAFLTSFGEKVRMLGSTEYVIPLFDIIPGMVLALAGLVLKLGGGIALLIGYRVREAALALVVFVVLATLMFHVGDGQLTSALSNLALIGGLLYVAAFGGGSYSLCKDGTCKAEDKQPDQPIGQSGSAI